MSSLAIFLILAACAVALYNWRWGVFAAITIALIQDPLRKLMPGTPGLMAMASVPVWLAMILGVLTIGELSVKRFFNQFPKLGRGMNWFGLYLIVPAFLSATYGRNTWQITILGAMIYFLVFMTLCSGWCFAVAEKNRINVLSFYAIGASIMLIGGPLQYLGWNTQYAVIGTEVMGFTWVTHRSTAAIYMIAGLFRSPDVMGWHAAMVFMIAVLMASRSRGAMRIFWIVIAIWGGVNIWLCGRRKMISMLPIFMGCHLLLVVRFREAQRWAITVGVILLVTGVGWHVVTSYVYVEGAETFYISAFHQAEGSLRRHGVRSVFTTIRQAGFLGYGMGMGQQGTHHIDADKPRLWQESGPSMLAAELGVPGMALFLVVLVYLGLTAYHVMCYTARDETFFIGAGIASILIANLTSGIVSGQIFGDPFVAILLALMAGMLLSGVRIKGSA